MDESISWWMVQPVASIVAGSCELISRNTTGHFINKFVEQEAILKEGRHYLDMRRRCLPGRW